MRCMAESNPPAKVWWEKEGVNGIFSPDKEITISPVTRTTAGTYKCVAQNALGMSEPAFVEVDVKCELFINADHCDDIFDVDEATVKEGEGQGFLQGNCHLQKQKKFSKIFAHIFHSTINSLFPLSPHQPLACLRQNRFHDFHAFQSQGCVMSGWEFWLS